MKRSITLTTITVSLALAAAMLAPTASLADGRLQQDKNNNRNIAAAGAVVAAFGILDHNGPATVIGAAAAIIGGSQFDRDQQIQNQRSHGWDYRSDHGRFIGDSNYGNDRDGCGPGVPNR